MFDDDGWLSAPFLDPSKSSVYANYRYAYAEILEMWSESLSRLEIMKFNVMKADRQPSNSMDGSLHDSFSMHDGTTAQPKAASSPIVMGKKDQLHAIVASNRGLDVTGICRIHETQLEPALYTSSDSRMGGAVGTCDRCRRTQSQLRCVYCLEPVDSLFPPCLSCGCASHEICLAEWHAAGETECPAGDECSCVEEAANGQVESWAALQGAMLKSKLTRLPSPATEEEEQEEEQEDGGSIFGFRSRRSSEAPPRQAEARPGRSALPLPYPATLAFNRLRKASGPRSPTLRGAPTRGR